MSLLAEEIKTWSRIGVKRLMSPALMDRLRLARRKAQRNAGAPGKAADSTPLAEARITDDLSVIGVVQGRDLFVHSALSKIGRVEGGAEAVVGALLTAIGPEGTLVMPAYPMPSTMHEWMSDPAPFCISSSPSRMGAITETFRKMPGVRRSAHPTHSVAAYGPAAELYTQDHHKALTPCAPGSPFRIHTDRGGDILCLGTGVGKITAYHVVEDYLDDFPLSVYLSRRMSKDVILADGARNRVEITVGDPRLSPWRVDNFKPKEIEFSGHLRSYAAAVEGKIGQARSHLINGARFHEMMLDLTRRGITIYHQPLLSRWLPI